MATSRRPKATAAVKQSQSDTALDLASDGSSSSSSSSSSALDLDLDFTALPENLPPMSEQAVAGRPQVYPVDFVLANNSSMGNDRYCLDLTDEQLRVMLRDDDSPRWVRIPDRYHAQNGNNEARYLSLANVVELHIGGGWQPPAEWEWGGLLKHLKALVVERASE